MRRLYRVPRALMTVLVVDVMCGCERSSGPQWSRAVPGASRGRFLLSVLKSVPCVAMGARKL
jgi:hypothetical protein